MQTIYVLLVVAVTYFLAFRAGMDYRSKKSKAKSMSYALLHAAHALDSYASEHKNQDRAFAARANASMMRSKAKALMEGGITPSFIESCQPSPNDGDDR